MLTTRLQRSLRTNQPGKTANPALPEGRCGHCDGGGKRRKVFFVVARKVSTDKAYEAVRTVVLAVRDRMAKGQEIAYHDKRLTREGLAVKLGLDVNVVHVALMRLNRDGFIAQRSNKAPHDSSRDPWHWGSGDSAWQASTYSIRSPLLDPATHAGRQSGRGPSDG